MNPCVEKAIKAAEKRDIENRNNFINEVCSQYVTSDDVMETVTCYGEINMSVPVVTDEEYEKLRSLYPETYSKINDNQALFDAVKTIKNCVVFFTVLGIVEIIAGIIYLIA